MSNMMADCSLLDMYTMVCDTCRDSENICRPKFCLLTMSGESKCKTLIPNKRQIYMYLYVLWCFVGIDNINQHLPLERILYM